jgi:hypothetical protein
VKVVNKPIYGNRILNKFFTSCPHVSQIEVFSNVVETKHRAVYVKQHAGPGIRCAKAVCKKLLWYDMRQHHV